ncbi:SAM-dependent methyltransferase [Streptomyces sp. NPDC020845]|uniref:SAM-dependent methyltransferase n=1 Tax=Streptomyces sp. NPDC020845 TaxID=3365096 RepID=UPI0037BA0D3E
MTDQGFSVQEIDTSTPHPARMYDYYLGGWDNYEVDRRAADRILEVTPTVRGTARANREFLLRAVRTVVGDGIRQIIDIGTGIPTSPNTHEVAREIAPETRVVYIDNDPIVATHAGAKLTNAGGTSFALGDVRKPAEVLDRPAVREFIDFGKPVALLLVAVLHFVKDEEDPVGILATLTERLVPGSCLVISHGTLDFTDRADIAAEVYRKSSASLSLRGRAEILPFFDGFPLLEPGLVQVPAWRPDGPLPKQGKRADVGVYGGVGRKP